MKRDEQYLRHICDSIRDIESFLEGIDLNDFVRNKEKQYAVIRALEIIGEAVKCIDADLKKKFSYIPWPRIAGMRNKLIHEYFGVKLELIWETARKDLPLFKQQILEILKQIKK